MNNIAIITLPLSNYNYGGILQAYALQKYLVKTFQVNVVHLDRDYNVGRMLYFKMKIHKLRHKSYYRAKNDYYKPIGDFILQDLILSPKFDNQPAMLRFLKRNHINFLLTGSDQVWRKDYALNIIEDLYLQIPYKAKKISYAASFGSEDYKVGDIHAKLDHLDAISVRENDAADHLCALGCTAYHHIDPTLLLSADHYSKIADNSTKEYKNGITVYLLDPSDELKKTVKNFAAEKDLKINFVGRKKSITLQNYREISQQVDSLQDWLKSFRDAEYIITDSFHGCIFSILFSKQFVTLGNKKRGLSRFNSLLESFNLQDRLITDVSQINRLLTPIDYNKVLEKLETFRTQSLDYFSQFFRLK